MINYIKAELFRNFNRKYFWVYTGIVVAALLGINMLLYFSHSGSQVYNLSTAMAMTTHVLSAPIFLIFAILDLSIMEEFKNLTIKNTLSFGLSRTTYIISKFIISIFFSFLMAIIVMITFYGSTALLFGIGDSSIMPISTFLSIIAASVPLWIASLAIGIFLSVIIGNSTIVSLVYIGLFLVFAPLIKLLYIVVWPNLIHVYNVLITPQLSSFAVKFNSASIEKAVIWGIIYTVVFISLSIAVFNKKDVK